MTDTRFTRAAGRGNTHARRVHAVVFVSDDTSHFTLTCFVKTIPAEIKRRITGVKAQTQICHNKTNLV